MKINGYDFKIGADPEIFMGMDGKFVSAHDIIPGDKRNPFKVDNGAVQVDGMALEFNIDPADNFEEFESNLSSVQQTLKDMIGIHDFIQDTSVKFDKQFLENVPIANKILGCDTDFNAWEMEENESPDADLFMRTVGGHVHVGGFHSKNPFNNKHFQQSARLARILDETLGVYSVLWDKDDERREMYGKAGSFRPKTYGMEYRTLSNSWIFKKELVKFVYDSVVESLEKMFDTYYEPDPEIRSIIDHSNVNSPFFENNKKAKFIRGLV